MVNPHIVNTLIAIGFNKKTNDVRNSTNFERYEKTDNQSVKNFNSMKFYYLFKCKMH